MCDLFQIGFNYTFNHLIITISLILTLYFFNMLYYESVRIK